MGHNRSVRLPNVLPFYAEPLLVASFCISVEQEFPEHSVVSVGTLNQWCEQIAAGMEYLVTKQVHFRLKHLFLTGKS